MKAVIMAGGDGKRLRPLSCTMPKPMVPLLNKLVELSKGAKSSTVQKMFSSHPDSEKRAARMKEKADAYVAAHQQ